MKGKLLKAEPLPGYGQDFHGTLYMLTIKTWLLRRTVKVIELVGYHINIDDFIGKNVSTRSKP